MENTKMQTKENVIVVIKSKNGNVKSIQAANLVTNDGDIFYAKKIVGEDTSTDFPNVYLRLGTGTTQPQKTDTDVETYIPNSAHVVDSGFPQRNNSDPGNTLGGEKVVTWKISYALGDLDAQDISEAALTNDPDNPTKAICRFLFQTPFSITSNDQLTVYINHSFNGV